MEHLEANKIIAEFMGARIYEAPNNGRQIIWWAEYPAELSPIPYETVRNLSSLEYDTDWNWLMPVVEKIEAMEEMDGNRIITKWVHIMGKGCIIEIDSLKDCEIAICHTHDSPMTKLEAVYTAVVEFIKWHNTQTKVV